VADAVRAARNGRLVVLPAEHGYVVATDAFRSGGVAALRAAKNLSAESTLGVLVGHAAGVHGIAALPAPGQDLIDAFWPGPLTLIVRAQPSLAWPVAGRVAVRMPLHPLLLDVLRDVGPMVSSAVDGPDAVPGAAVVLDVGPRPAGPPSAGVDLTAALPCVVRLGGVDPGQLAAVVPLLAGPVSQA
jgi:tRNA threonylcarbamoyl adenosine modification protein (Sua5/YciO/YrdC/YwlC family)